MKPKTDWYASLKAETSVESVYRSWLPPAVSPGGASWAVVEFMSLAWTGLVTMALWETLRGIIVLGTGAFNTI
jgi:hypothetical protein